MMMRRTDLCFPVKKKCCCPRAAAGGGVVGEVVGKENPLQSLFKVVLVLITLPLEAQKGGKQYKA